MYVVRHGETRCRELLWRLLGILSLLLLYLSGCSGGSGDGRGSTTRVSRVTLQLTIAEPEGTSFQRSVPSSRSTRQVLPGDPGFLTRLEIQVRAPDITPIMRRVDLTAEGQEAVTVELTVPQGSQRQIIVAAFNAAGVEIFHGETTINLTREIEGVELALVRILVPTPATAPALAQQVFQFTDGPPSGWRGAPAR